MPMIDKKLFRVYPLREDAKQYLFEELYKHVQTTVLLANLTAIVFMLFELERPKLVLIWLIPMCILQTLRYFIATKAITNTSPKLRYLFLAVDYVTISWWVAYIYIFGWQTTSTFEYLFRTFMVFTVITFYLNVMRYNFTYLVINSTFICVGIFLYLLMFTQLPPDFKWSMGLLITFGYSSLLLFGRMSHLLACETYELITENKLLISKMNAMLAEDDLTHQPNRRYFNSELSKHLMLHQNSHQTFCLAILDIDYFKRVNDTYGHDVGDAVLISIGKFIRHQIRSSDIFARYGGEEFVIILPSTKQAVAKKILDKMRVNCAIRPFNIDTLLINISISIGLTEVEPGDYQTSIIKRADIALYAAKGNGRNRVEVTQS